MENMLHSWIRRLSIIKMAVFPNRPTDLGAIPVKIPAAFLCGNGEIFPKLHMEMQEQE